VDRVTKAVGNKTVLCITFKAIGTNASCDSQRITGSEINAPLYIFLIGAVKTMADGKPNNKD